jgi:hypothetical protein
MPPVELIEPPLASEPDPAATQLEGMTTAPCSPTPSKTIPLGHLRPSPESPPDASPTRADDLLARFGVSCCDEASMREAAACLRRSRPALRLGRALVLGALVGALFAARMRPDLVASIAARLAAASAAPEAPPAALPASEARAR